MKNLLKLTIASTVLVTSLSASAQDSSILPEVDVPDWEKDPGNVIVPMNRLQLAPFTGLLLSPSAASMIVVQLNSLDERIQIETTRVQKEADARCTFKIKEQKIEYEYKLELKDAEIDKQKIIIDTLNDRLSDLEGGLSKPAWFGIGLGVGATAVTVLAASIGYVAMSN